MNQNNSTWFLLKPALKLVSIRTRAYNSTDNGIYLVTASRPCPQYILVCCYVNQLFRALHSTETRPWSSRGFFFTLHRLQRSSVPMFGTSRYQARYSSRTLRFALSKSRLRIGFTILETMTADCVAVVDAMTALFFFIISGKCIG